MDFSLPDPPIVTTVHWRLLHTYKLNQLRLAVAVSVLDGNIMIVYFTQRAGLLANIRNLSVHEPNSPE